MVHDASILVSFLRRGRLYFRDPWVQLLVPAGIAALGAVWTFAIFSLRSFPDVVLSRSATLGVETILRKDLLLPPAAGSIIAAANFTLAALLFSRLRPLSLAFLVANVLLFFFLGVALLLVFLLNH